MRKQKLIKRPALLPLTFFYGLAVLLRNWLFDTGILKSRKFKIPVISIGNITVGGTGKTPHVEYLVDLLRKEYSLAVLSRGYKRKTKDFRFASKRSPIREIGDEPLQIKLKFPNVPVAVERDRVEGIKKLMHTINGLEVVLLDDAYQHRKVKPGLSILLIDYNRPIFNDMLLPAGNLREFRRNTNRADLIMVTKCPESLTPYESEAFISKLNVRKKQQVFFTRYEYGSPLPVFPVRNQEELTYKHLHKSGTCIMLVTGIANPFPLRNFLSDIVNVREEMAFPDHHDFTRQDIQLIRRTFNTMEAEEKYIIVTEKDAVRIRESEFDDKSFKKSFYYIPIEVKFLLKGEKPFIKRILKYLKKNL